MTMVLLQMACGSHLDLLDITYHHHNRYAQRHGMVYRTFRESSRLDLPPSWCKLDLMLKEFAKGAKVVVWMDADAVVDDMAQDIALACPYGVGMVRYDQPFCHYQAGVIVAHASEEVIAYFEDVLEESRKDVYDRPGKYGVWEQHPLNMIGIDRGLIASIHPRWNFVPLYAKMEGRPAVFSYHGYPFDQRKEALVGHVSRRRRS